MLILKIRQAEVALAGGRLDECRELVVQPKMRQHRQGQALVSRLVEAYLARGRQHLAEGRPALAKADAEHAAGLAGDLPGVAELRQAAMQALEAQHQREHQQQHQLDAARQEMRNGRLGQAAAVLADVSISLPAVREVLQQVESKRVRLNRLLEQVRRHLDEGELSAAAGALAEARGIDGADSTFLKISLETAARLRLASIAALEAGRPDLVKAHLAQLRRFAEPCIEARQIERTLALLEEAWQDVQRGAYDGAAQALRRVAAAHASAAWMINAAEQMEEMDRLNHRLYSGPLSWFAGHAKDERIVHDDEAPAAVHGPSVVAQQTLPERFLLQVDGVGSFLVVRGGRIMVGPVSGRSRPDVPLLCDPSSGMVRIERKGEDYFLQSDRPVTVNEQPVSGKLLADGDRIAISPRCRLRFAVPHAASTTAVLDVAAGRLVRGDVRRVILLDRELIIGPGSAAHVRVEEMSRPVVLQMVDGQLVRQAGRERRPIGTGQAVTIEGVSLMVTEMS